MTWEESKAMDEYKTMKPKLVIHWIDPFPMSGACLAGGWYSLPKPAGQGCLLCAVSWLYICLWEFTIV